MQYTDDQKAEAVRLYLEHGPAHAAEVVGCSQRSVYHWLGFQGLQPKNPDEHRAETVARHTAKRETLRELLMDRAIDMLHRMNEPHVATIMHDGEIAEIIHQKAEAADCKSYGIALGILVDKYRLEMGEATVRSEEVASHDIDRSVAQLVAELARRGEASPPPGVVDRAIPSGPATP